MTIFSPRSVRAPATALAFRILQATGATDPDGLYERARVAGLEITRDPWLVSWSLGTYPGG